MKIPASVFIAMILMMLSCHDDSHKGHRNYNSDTIFSKTYYPNSSIKEEFSRYNFDNTDTSIYDARLRTYHANGNRRMEMFYHSYKKNGVETKWYENGNIEHIGVMRDGVADSTWVWYFETGVKSEINNYIDGELFGEILTFYRDGKINEYKFIGGNERIMFIRNYDSIGNIIKEQGFPYTISTESDTLSVGEFYEPWIYIGNLPGWDIELRVIDLINGENIYRINGDEMISTPYGKFLPIKRMVNYKGNNAWVIEMTILDKEYSKKLNRVEKLSFYVK